MYSPHFVPHAADQLLHPEQHRAPPRDRGGGAAHGRGVRCGRCGRQPGLFPYDPCTLGRRFWWGHCYARFLIRSVPVCVECTPRLQPMAHQRAFSDYIHCRRSWLYYHITADGLEPTLCYMRMGLLPYPQSRTHSKVALPRSALLVGTRLHTHSVYQFAQFVQSV